MVEGKSRQEGMSVNLDPCSNFSAKLRQRNAVFRQVFWLPDLPTGHPFPFAFEQWDVVAVVPGYSSASATDSHRLPIS